MCSIILLETEKLGVLDMRMYALRNIKTGCLLYVQSYNSVIARGEYKNFPPEVETTYKLRNQCNAKCLPNVPEIWLVTDRSIAESVLRKGRTELDPYEDGSIIEPIFYKDVNLEDIEIVEVNLTIKEK